MTMATNKAALAATTRLLVVSVCLLLLSGTNHYQVHYHYSSLHLMTVTATVTGKQHLHYQQQQQHQLYPCYQSSVFGRCHRKRTRRYPFVTVDQHGPNQRESKIRYVSSNGAVTRTVLSYTNKNIDETTTSTSSSSSSSTTVVTTTKSSLTGVIVDITLQHHRPLGCVIEESLATSSTIKGSTNKIVFVTSTSSNGNAEQAGIMIGDVIVGISSNIYFNNNNDNNHSDNNTTGTTINSSTSSTSKDCATTSMSSSSSSSSSSSIIDVTSYSIERL
jgi:hypothetical protein